VSERLAQWLRADMIFWKDKCRCRSHGQSTLARDFHGMTTEAIAEVGAVHPKAMPVILTTEAEDRTVDGGAGTRRAERPLLDGTPKIVMTGDKEDPAV
jgi:hypothetical protein